MITMGMILEQISPYQQKPVPVPAETTTGVDTSPGSPQPSSVTSRHPNEEEEDITETLTQEANGAAEDQEQAALHPPAVLRQDQE